MSITRRGLGGLAAGLPLVPLGAPRAAAQAYPTRPITCVVAYGPGTGTDLLDGRSPSGCPVSSASASWWRTSPAPAA